jgi:hypothetical protein
MRLRLLLVGSLALALILALDVLPFLRGGFGWQWPYDPVPLRALPLAVALVVYTAVAGLLLRRTQRDGLLLLWAAVGVVLLSLAALLLRSHDALYELFVRTASGVTTGQHFAGVEIDWSDPAWVNWPQTVAPFEGRSGHIVLSGPLLPLFYGLLNRLLAELPGIAEPLQRALLPYQCRNYDLLVYTPAEWASAWLGMLMPVWVGLGVLPLYRLARRLAGVPAARLAVLWWPLVPALILFAPTWNTVYPLAALAAFGLLLHGLEGRHRWAWVLAGLISGVLTFANLSLLPLLGLLGFYTLLYDLWLGRRPWYQPVIVGLWFAVGLALPWLIFALVSGLTPLDLFNFAMANHLILDRPYVPWLWLHSWEWVLLTGIPVVVLWLGFALRRRAPQPVQALALALLLTMLVLVFSGTARGETGRVWLFFAPFVLICAAAALAAGRAVLPRAWLLISSAQGTLLLAIGASWLLINAPNMSPPPAPPGPVDAPRSVAAVFADQFRLIGWDAVVSDDTLELRLNWQADQQMTRPYWFSALLVAPDGTLPQPAAVWQALDTRYPTTCWRPGEIVGDTVRLPFTPQSGAWWISLSAFADETDPEARLTVRLPDGSVDNQVGLGPVVIGE